MPRPLRLPNLPFHWYYFVRKAAGKRQLVANSAELRIFQNLLSAALAQCGARLHFAHVDGNEIHLALQSGPHSISAKLGAFCRQYARAINRARNEQGSLFRPHARVVLVQQQRWFLSLGRYIHWIPRLRSLNSKDMLWWNTESAYRTRRATRGVLTSTTFRMLSRRSADPGIQDRAYRAFFDQRPIPDEVRRLNGGASEDSRILGDSNFIWDVLQRLGVRGPREEPKWSETEGSIRRAMLTFIRKFWLLCDRSLPVSQAEEWKRVTTLVNVCSKSRVPPLPMIRGIATSYLVERRIATVRQAERFFGCRPGTLPARRRRLYETKFRALFKQPYEQWLHSLKVEGVDALTAPPTARARKRARALTEVHAEAMPY